jgi:glycosyltransferase involved in cell wall biosynthesis
MNILYLTQVFSSSRGGGNLLFYDFAKSFSEEGNKAHIICNLSTEKELPNIYVHKVKPIIRETNQVPTTIVPNLRYVYNAIWKGLSVIEKYEIDIIHTNSLLPVIIGGILGKLKKVPVVATIHDVFTGDESNRWKQWLEANNSPRYYGVIGELMERLSLSMPVDAIHTISRSSYNDIRKMKSKSRIEIIFPSVDRREYQSPSPIVYENFILYLGRLVFYKNLDVLLKAFRIVMGTCPDHSLIIAGDGPMRSKWQSLAVALGIEKNVVFVGNISNEQKIDLLNRCLALAFPSTFEGFGLVILESFLFRKPVLASDVNPFDEIIENDSDGFLIPFDDPEAWAKRIIELINNRELCKKMGNNGFSKYLDEFEYTNYIHSIQRLYESLIKLKGN